MWQMIISFLMRVGLGLLGVMFKSLTDRAVKAGVDDTALGYFSQLIDSADQNPAMKDDPDAKWKWVWNEAVDYCSKHGLALATSFLETTLTGLVHNAHWGDTAAADATPGPLQKIA